MLSRALPFVGYAQASGAEHQGPKLWAYQEAGAWIGRECRETYLEEAATLFDCVFLLECRAGRVHLVPKNNPNQLFLNRACLFRDFLADIAAHRHLPDVRLAIDVEDEAREHRRYPVFTFQKQRGSLNLLLPDVDFLSSSFYADDSWGLPDPTAFADKRHGAIFIGSTTGAGHVTIEKLGAGLVPRVQSGRFFKGHTDVVFALTNLVQCSEQARAVLIEEGFGGPNILWRDQLQFRFQISMDGNGATCSRVYIALASNAVLLKYPSHNVLCYSRGLVEGRHYLGIKVDEDVLEILRQDPATFATIADQGRDFARRFLTRESLQAYTAHLLDAYASLAIVRR